MKEKEKLIAQIERRKKLLSNENYVNKAPANVVENDRVQLEKEQLKLEEILAKLKQNLKNKYAIIKVVIGR